MFEKVNKFHPDKLADRIAGAIVDLAYSIEENPKVAVEVLLGHGCCKIITESNINFADEEHKNKVFDLVQRICEVDGITGIIATEIIAARQDSHLAKNQEQALRCGDNGIFKGVPTNDEEQKAADIARILSRNFGSDGKYILDVPSSTLIICQAGTDQTKDEKYIKKLIDSYATIKNIRINPLGDWTGGIAVDAGATNRKLGSDMGRAVTGGGLHGKDLSKADVSVNIMCHILANEWDCEVEAFCAIGDKEVKFNIKHPEGEYSKFYGYGFIADAAMNFIKNIGGFEKFAEWGFIK